MAQRHFPFLQVRGTDATSPRPPHLSNTPAGRHTRPPASLWSPASVPHPCRPAISAGVDSRCGSRCVMVITLSKSGHIERRRCVCLRGRAALWLVTPPGSDPATAPHHRSRAAAAPHALPALALAQSRLYPACIQPVSSLFSPTLFVESRLSPLRPSHRAPLAPSNNDPDDPDLLNRIKVQYPKPPHHHPHSLSLALPFPPPISFFLLPESSTSRIWVLGGCG